MILTQTLRENNPQCIPAPRKTYIGEVHLLCSGFQVLLVFYFINCSHYSQAFISHSHKLSNLNFVYLFEKFHSHLDKTSFRRLLDDYLRFDISGLI